MKMDPRFNLHVTISQIRQCDNHNQLAYLLKSIKQKQKAWELSK